MSVGHAVYSVSSIGDCVFNTGGSWLCWKGIMNEHRNPASSLSSSVSGCNPPGELHVEIRCGVPRSVGEDEERAKIGSTEFPATYGAISLCRFERRNSFRIENTGDDESLRFSSEKPVSSFRHVDCGWGRAFGDRELRLPKGLLIQESASR